MQSIINDISSQLEGFFNAHERVQTVYSKKDQLDLSVPALYLNGYAIPPEIDRKNMLLTFACGTRVSEILAVLEDSSFLIHPFDSFDRTSSIGKFITHQKVFSSDSFAAMTVILPDGRVLRLGKGTYSSAAGFRAIDLFIATKNIIGVPAVFVYKLQPNNLPQYMKERLYYTQGTEIDINGEDRKILLRLKSLYDPYHLLNTFYI